MKWLPFCFVLLLAGSCTLSASQEASLHQALTSYVDAHNNGAVMAFVSYTHPNVVGFYEDQGDSIFRQKFELFSSGNGGDFLEESSLKKIAKGDGQIHVRYVFDTYTEVDFDYEYDEIGIIAISVDDGAKWFFAEEEDYKNEKIFSKDEQLIDL